MSTVFSDLGLADRFSLILEGLRRTAAARMAGNRDLTPLLLLLWGRLHRVATRFAQIVAQVRAGALAPPRPRKPGHGSAPRTKTFRLPESFAWLVRLTPQTAVFGSQLQHLLSDPDMSALVAAAPQLGRLLRPMCRMLGVPSPTWLQRPVPTATAVPPPGGETETHIDPPSDRPDAARLAPPDLQAPEKTGFAPT